MSANPIGFGNLGRSGYKQAVEKAFSPEFRNRLDAVIPFQSLDEAIILRIVDKFLDELRTRLADSAVTLKVSAAARADLARRGYDPVYGARPLARLIQTAISDVLAGELLFGRLSDGGEVRIGLRAGELTFAYGPA